MGRQLIELCAESAPPPAAMPGESASSPSLRRKASVIFTVWPSIHGSDCFLLANDEGQAGDDLSLATKLIEANPSLQDDIEVRAKELVRRDGAGALQILPAQNVAGQHGKSKASSRLR